MESNNLKKHQPCVILFAKAPIPGHVKTRLAKDMGETRTLSLYWNFVRDSVDKITSAGHYLKIFHDPPGSLPLMQDWLGQRHEYFLQEGVNLGLKMANAFIRVFSSGIHQAVLMGADFPDLPAMILADALSGLDTHAAVIGPTLDGGYYLIGFNADSFLTAVFENIPWSTSGVFEKTMSCFTTTGARVKQLPKWRDIDTCDDLKILIQSLTRHPEHCPHTAAYLTRIGLIPDSE
ncbi:MAG: hypothetical protein COX19_16510 [Desulfobacterales bacterium CG23_combo_of_CG06-09_8_20_14_all_51_8]|nr:MAG: hypothetical protein COX19_16510 [Desulfobacterales bacterium CG23_combo_of_CG06-09_8_20_14_all_51_8]